MRDMVSGQENSVLAADLSSDANRERQMQRQKDHTNQQTATALQAKAAKLQTKARRLPLNSNGRKKKEAEARGLLSQAAALLRPQVEEARRQMAEQMSPSRQTPKPTKPSIFR